MVFTRSTYTNLVTEESAAQQRLFLQYLGPRNDFDIVIVGSGMGGGILADDLAERVGGSKRILLLEAGSFIYPTHVYNMCRFSNCEHGPALRMPNVLARAATRAASSHRPRAAAELRRSVDLLVRADPGDPAVGAPVLSRRTSAMTWSAGLLNRAGDTMNESHSMGSTAAAIVSALRQSPLAADFSIQETPRALHQPYLVADGTPQTGVLHRADGRVQHRRAAHQSGRPHAGHAAR